MAKNSSFARLLASVKPDASPEEIDQVLDSDEPPQIFAQSVSLQAASYTNPRIRHLTCPVIFLVDATTAVWASTRCFE